MLFGVIKLFRNPEAEDQSYEIDCKSIEKITSLNAILATTGNFVSLVI